MSLEPIPQSAQTALCATHPDLPADYISFLSTHGWGDLTSGVRLYAAPVSTDYIYGTRSGSLPEVVIIGDDFAGTTFAFVPSQNWIIVAISALDLDMYPEGSFSEFIAQYHEPPHNA